MSPASDDPTAVRRAERPDSAVTSYRSLETQNAYGVRYTALSARQGTISGSSKTNCSSMPCKASVVISSLCHAGPRVLGPPGAGGRYQVLDHPPSGLGELDQVGVVDQVSEDFQGGYGDRDGLWTTFQQAAEGRRQYPERGCSTASLRIAGDPWKSTWFLRRTIDNGGYFSVRAGEFGVR